MFVLVFFMMLGSLGYGVFSLFKKKFKQGSVLLGLTIILFFVCGLVAPESTRLSLNESEITTDENGLAVVSGKTNEKAILTLANKEIKIDDDGKFSVEYQLEEDKDSLLTISARYKNQEISKEVNIQASKEFKKKLSAQKEKLEKEKELKALNEQYSNEKKKIETALVLAEKEVTKVNYQAAKTLIDQYSNDDKEEFSTRLSKIDKLLQLAELTETVESAIALAEEDMSRENYQAAVSALEQLSEKPETLSNRLSNVDSKLTQLEQQATLALEEDHQHNEVAEAENSQIVLVTPTGSKYHSRVCGNGNYTEATLAEAQARGLTACKKCY